MVDAVDASEIVYRRVPADLLVPGEQRAGERAFLDRSNEPSVDRAKLRNFDPSITQESPKNAVAEVVVEKIRAIEDVHRKSQSGKIEHTYTFDVKPDPIKDDPELPDNDAHAKICGDQQLTSGPSKKLGSKLSFISLIVLMPSE